MKRVDAHEPVGYYLFARYPVGALAILGLAFGPRAPLRGPAAATAATSFLFLAALAGNFEDD
jgi:hypothetical protein